MRRSCPSQRISSPSTYVGAEALQQALDDPWIDEYLAEAESAWTDLKYAGKTPTVPLLFTGGHVIRGSTRVADELIEYFEQQVFTNPLTAKPAALQTASDEASP